MAGSRFSRHSVLLNYPLAKIIFNRGFHLLANVVMGRGFRDVTNNLKLLRHDVVERLLLTSPGFAVNAETGLLPVLMGYPLTECPISWINRSYDMGHSSFKLVKVGGSYIEVLWNVLRARDSPPGHMLRCPKPVASDRFRYRRVNGYLRKLNPVAHQSRAATVSAMADQDRPRQSGVSYRILAGIGANLPILLLVTVLTISVILISPRKPLWNDELFSYYFVTANSIGTLWHAFNDS